MFSRCPLQLLPNKAMKKQATRKGAISAMRPDTPEANFLLAMFCKAVSAPNGRRMAELAIDCAHQRELALAVPEKFDWKARRNKWLSPQLAELLGDSPRGIGRQAVRGLCRRHPPSGNDA